MRSLHPALQVRLAALQQYKIKHASLEKMDDLLMNAIDEHTSYSILTLYGPSGVGKSTVMKRIAQRCREEEPDSSVVPVVVLQISSLLFQKRILYRPQRSERRFLRFGQASNTGDVHPLVEPVSRYVHALACPYIPAENGSVLTCAHHQTPIGAKDHCPYSARMTV